MEKRPYKAPAFVGAMVTPRHRELAMRAIRGATPLRDIDHEWIKNALVIGADSLFWNEFWAQATRIAQAIADAEQPATNALNALVAFLGGWANSWRQNEAWGFIDASFMLSKIVDSLLAAIPEENAEKPGPEPDSK